MPIDKVIEQTFPVKCKGRNAIGREVLKKPIKAKIRIYQRPESDMISSEVKCKYNIGSHGHKCKAQEYRLVNKIGEMFGICPYAFDIPYALEKDKK